jgi:hypothetical protein
MRLIQRGPASLGDGVLRDFARSLQTADLALATRRGYAADLGRFRAWIEKGRGEAVRLRRGRRMILTAKSRLQPSRR